MIKSKTCRDRFKAILSGPECVFPGSVWDPLSARSAEYAGYEVAILAGSVASLAVLGAPDLTVLTLTEFAEQARRICRATSLPLLVDADHGYGNALSVMRTVEELEVAGVAALTIEDTSLPQPFGAAAAQLISVEEGVGKMRAALAARQDESLVIVGRTGAVAISSVEDACTRCNAYADTGVDAIFVSGVKTREELAAIRAAVRIPIILGTINAALADSDYLAGQGVRVALQGHLPIAAATQAAHETHKSLREGTLSKESAEQLAKFPMSRFSNAASYQEWSSAFLAQQPK